MSTKGVVDVVFCLDASDSMKPCIDGVKAHISSFLEGLKADRQRTWDVRFDFLAHCALFTDHGTIGHAHFSLFHNVNNVGEGNSVLDALYNSQQGRGGRFFTTDIEEFKRGLDEIEVAGDEGPLVALDSCLDFPWRNVDECHRVIIFMTDEPFETSSNPDMERGFLEEILQKTQDLRVLLFIVAPDSAGYEELAEVDKSEYEAVESESNGLADVDFGKLLSGIGKSVSVSTANQQGVSVEKKVKRGVFGQMEWGSVEGDVDLTDRT
jgi:hypothetical protein